MSTVRRNRGGFGFWIVAVIVLILLLALMGGASHWQNRELHRSIVEAYLGRAASAIAASAVEEAYYRLHHHLLTPVVDPSVATDWDSLLVSVPDGSKPSEVVPPAVTRAVFLSGPGAPADYNVEDIADVKMALVHREMDFGHGFWCGAVEFATAVRLSIGGFPSGISVTRRLRVRKRYYATQISATQSPVIRFMAEDLSREVLRQ